MTYQYIDDQGLPVVSDEPLGYPQRPSLLGQERTAADIRAEQLSMVEVLISKRQKAGTTSDPWKMWRYYNNAQVARDVLAGTADGEMLAAFNAMLAANQADDPDYYGGMVTQTFAEWLIGLNREFALLGLKLEAERIRQRRALSSL